MNFSQRLKAGIQLTMSSLGSWTPAFAGVTTWGLEHYG